MSTHASTVIDQKEYLKKYLSGDKTKKKKKDKKHKKETKTTSTVKIIDDDLSVLANGHEIDEELFLGGEDAPQIVGEYIEEMGLNGPKAAKWRSIAVKDEKEEGDEMKKVAAADTDLWGRKDVVRKNKDEFSPSRRNSSKDTKRPTTPDISPPRRRQKQEKEYSPARRKEQLLRRKGKDQSPLSKKRSSVAALGRSSRKSSSVDHSPVRKKRDSPARYCKEDQSNPRRRRQNSPADRSPPRQRRKVSTDQSPPRRRSKDSSHQSPSRRRPKDSTNRSSPKRRQQDFSDQSPLRRRQDSSDQSPPRRTQQVSADQSPPRRHRRHNSDHSPPRRLSKSPLRIKREKQSPNQSPPRKSNIKKEHSPAPPTVQSPAPTLGRRSRWEKAGSASPPPTHKPKTTKTLDGKRAGLQDAKSLQTETEERRRQEDRMFAEMSKDISGRDAEVQVRSTGRRGQRARDAQAEDPEQRRRKEAHEQKKKELYDRWGKGLKQIEDHRSRLEEQAYEGSKPLARYNDDEDLDRHLRDQERADDPMLEYMRQKNKERQKQANVPTMPTYKGSFPENRFGIRPGYRWDGVDRSNGYEKKWFDVQNEKRAIQDEAYKYSVEDM